MDRLQTEDGQHFIRSLAQFIRQHEKALANSLQLSVQRRQHPRNISTTSLNGSTNVTLGGHGTSTTSSLATALSFAGLDFMSHSIKAAHLTLTAHHLFYLLSRFEELDIAVGPMNVRLENIHSDPSPSNYVSFLQQPKIPPKGRSDRDSIHSVSSVRSVMSGMGAFWSSIGLGSSASKSEKAKAATEADLKYLYSAFTKLPSLRLTTDHRARLISGYEEFPFDTAVPLFAFKNVQQLDIVDTDFRSFQGWDRLSEQLCLLTVKRANLDDPAELLTDIVLDDAERRRRRSTKGGRGSPTPTSSWTMPSTPQNGYAISQSDPGSPENASPSNDEHIKAMAKDRNEELLAGSVSPKRPTPARPTSSYRHVRTQSSKIRRSGSGSSNSSDFSVRPYRSESVSNLLTMNILPANKWQRLKYLSLADNSLTHISAKSLAPLAGTLRSLNLSSNLFTEIPDSLSLLTRLTSLDLSNCMIESLQSLTKNPLPAILSIKLKSNRLESLAGVERLLSLENLNIQGNNLGDPTEAARLTGIPNLRKIWVKHNPFAKMYTDYRITIFNIFRKTSGYVEDIIIDEQGPGYSERKLLVERVPEIDRMTIQQQIRVAPAPVVLHQASVIEPKNPEAKQVRAPTRRKKSSRRRIVDLAQDNVAHATFTEESAPLPSVSEAVRVDLLTTKPLEEIIDTNATLSDASELDLDADGDAAHAAQDDSAVEYRDKIEALRQQFGANWLSALGDRQWHQHHHIEVGRAHETSHEALHRGNNHVIVSGGRTLG